MVPSNATLLLAGFAADFINQGKSYTGINIKCCLSQCQSKQLMSSNIFCIYLSLRNLQLIRHWKEEKKRI